MYTPFTIDEVGKLCTILITLYFNASGSLLDWKDDWTLDSKLFTEKLLSLSLSLRLCLDILNAKLFLFGAGYS